jgi:glyoxylase-like metal-dependent hydrolase (beta-lactamase superfamily II)
LGKSPLRPLKRQQQQGSHLDLASALKRDGVRRRGLLKATGAGLLASGITSRAFPETLSSATDSVVHFAPEGGLTQVSPNLYLLRDTCNVYVLKNGDRALLIDFGSGHVLKLLGQIGITKVDGILHTHHHRDQCQGDGRAVGQRIPIHVPAHERHLFEDAENFWRNRRVFHLYYVRNDFFTLTHNLPVAGVLRDYETFRWGPYEFLIFPTPGHTLGAISLVGKVDGKKVAFSGDLIHSPGKVANLYELQYEYASADGVDVAIFSLAKLRELGLELICPSHGEPFANPETGITDLIGKLKGWWESYSPGMSLSSTMTVKNQPYAITPHLVCSYRTNSSNYAIISDSGKALFVDYGSASWNVFKSLLAATPRLDRIRFVEHTIPELQARYGLKSIEVAMPSHAHDDHLDGFPHLIRHYGTKVWCYENMVDVLQNPRGYNLGCLLGESIHVDRSFQHGESFEWEGYHFTVYHFPGHTEYQMLLLASIDGARIAFTGDAFEPVRVGQSYELHHDLIFRNWVENDSHLKSIRTILEHEPNIVAPGHGRPFVCNKSDLEDLQRRIETQGDYFSSVIADPDCNFGLNPSWVRLYPYQVQARAGSSSGIELRVRNYRSKPMHLEAALVLPPGWEASPNVVSLTVPPNEEGREGFTVTIPVTGDRSSPRVALAADVRADGQYLGEIAEAVADLSSLE